MKSSVINSDFLVIGSGIAGLSFALKAAEHGSVRLITKNRAFDSSTNRAQGGIASVLGTDDSFDLHVKDTLEAGVGLCREDAVKVMVEEGPERVRELIEWGVEFTRKRNKEEFDLGMEGGHSVNRVIHAGDITGREIEKLLVEEASNHPNIILEENRMAVDLITEHHFKPNFLLTPTNISCYGAYVLDTESGRVSKYLAHNTLLSTGGVGHVYQHTTNPEIATGDGIAMAYRAGARLSSLEFMQFHPTSLYTPNGDTFLLSEAIRGFGGKLMNIDGESFIKEEFDERGELAPRDIVARAIDNIIKRRGDKYVYLDLRHLDPDSVIERFPNIYEKCLEFKIDITKEPIPIVPAAHYICGGVTTDINGAASVGRLWATGETACTGVHGANRLASNSLLEALVFSHRAIGKIVDDKQIKATEFPEVPDWDESGTLNTEEWVLISHDRIEIQQLMWDYVGIIRTDLRLERAMRRLLVINTEIEDFYKRTRVTQGLVELRNMAAAAYLIVKSAQTRKESRGLHFNADHPELIDDWSKRETEIIHSF